MANRHLGLNYPYSHFAVMRLLEFVQHHSPFELPDDQDEFKSVRTWTAQQALDQGYQGTFNTFTQTLWRMVRDGYTVQSEDNQRLEITHQGRFVYESTPEVVLQALREEVTDPTQRYWEDPPAEVSASIDVATATGVVADTVQDLAAAAGLGATVLDEARASVKLDQGEGETQHDPAAEAAARKQIDLRDSRELCLGYDMESGELCGLPFDHDGDHKPTGPAEAEDEHEEPELDYRELADEMLVRVAEILAGPAVDPEELAELHSALDTANARVAQLEGELREANDEHRRQRDQLRGVEGELRATKRDLETAQDEAKQLRGQLGNANARIGQLNGAVERARVSGTALGQRLNDDSRRALDKIMQQIPAGR